MNFTISNWYPNPIFVSVSLGGIGKEYWYQTPSFQGVKQSKYSLSISWMKPPFQARTANPRPHCLWERRPWTEAIQMPGFPQLDYQPHRICTLEISGITNFTVPQGIARYIRFEKQLIVRLHICPEYLDFHQGETGKRNCVVHFTGMVAGSYSNWDSFIGNGATQQLDTVFVPSPIQSLRTSPSPYASENSSHKIEPEKNVWNSI